MQFIKSEKFSKAGLRKDIVVLHATTGSYEGAVEWLTKGIKEVSAHFVIGRKKGEVSQLVKTENDAWHCGVINNPTKRGLAIMRKNWLKFINPNKYCIGIEFAMYYDINKDGQINPQEKFVNKYQIDECINILRTIENDPTNDFIADSKHIITHKDITSYKPDLELTRLLILHALKNGNQMPEKKEEIITEKNEVKHKTITVTDPTELTMQNGQKLTIEYRGDRLYIRK